MAFMLIEAETFDNLGGWVIDTQCTEAMGSPYIMAHGLGHPVADATTTFSLPESGHWHVFARTRDWTCAWGRGASAGRFQLLIDGCALDPEFGTNGSDWAWQPGGAGSMEAGPHRLALRDLTGFNGRCDAIYLTTDPQDVPPDDAAACREFRRLRAARVVEEDPVEYDLLVCGGGYAGLCAAVSAKWLRMKVLLVQDRGVCGGCNSSEVRVWLGGCTNVGEYPMLGNVSRLLGPICGRPPMRKTAEIFEDARKVQLLDPGQNLLLHESVVEVEMDASNPRRIAAVVTQGVRTGRLTRRRAKQFLDATGDALLARRSGCEVRYGREGRSAFGESLAPERADRLVMGHSTLWEVGRRETPVAFPDIDWGIEFNDANGLPRENCCWDWETGQRRDQVLEIERIRDYGLMTAIANWSWLKNRAACREAYSHHELEWVSPIGGKRESYRVVGDHVMSEKDLVRHAVFEDGTAAVTWNIDLHYPDPDNEDRFGEAFQSCAYHHGIGRIAQVPYRCLYARDCDNLFLGGRSISATHVAFGAVRVMRTLGMLGEVVAMAADICRRHGCQPRDVYRTHLAELKAAMQTGIHIAQDHAYLPNDHELYHFMRPVGSVGNDDENIWLRVGPDGHALEPPPHETIRRAIARLGHHMVSDVRTH